PVWEAILTHEMRRDSSASTAWPRRLAVLIGTTGLDQGGSMSNHFTGLRFGPPGDDPRLDLTDLFAFPAPGDPTRTGLILDSNPFAIGDAYHPDAVYRINVDNDGDAETDIAFSVVFSEPEDGRQTATVYKATGPEARDAEPVGTPIVSDAEVSFGAEPNV